jgi:aminoglycoside 3-N-acetyltransferase
MPAHHGCKKSTKGGTSIRWSGRQVVRSSGRQVVTHRIEHVFSRAELADGFRALGVVPADTVMVHASVRAVGPIAGGPDQIHLAIKDALTDRGTLMMYASCPDGYDDVGRGAYPGSHERQLLEKMPAFDARTARAQRDNGTLVEFFRSYPDSLVNDHVARFVVWGAQAPYLISEQPWDYAFGRGSALERFVELDGKILLIGCDHDQVTFLHYAEHILGVPGLRIAVFEVPVLENGVRVWKEMKEIDTSGDGAHPNWPDRFFAQIVNAYLAKTQNRGGRVGHAHCFLFDAKGLLELALDEMRSVALKPEQAG